MMIRAEDRQTRSRRRDDRSKKLQYMWKGAGEGQTQWKEVGREEKNTKQVGNSSKQGGHKEHEQLAGKTGSGGMVGLEHARRQEGQEDKSEKTGLKSKRTEWVRKDSGRGRKGEQEQVGGRAKAWETERSGSIQKGKTQYLWRMKESHVGRHRGTEDMSSGLSLLYTNFFVHSHNFVINYILSYFRSKKPVTHTDSWLERHFGSSSSSLRQQSVLNLI